jgi:hypothetical protein
VSPVIKGIEMRRTSASARYRKDPEFAKYRAIVKNRAPRTTDRQIRKWWKLMVEKRAHECPYPVLPGMIGISVRYSGHLKPIDIGLTCPVDQVENLINDWARLEAPANETCANVIHDLQKPEELDAIGVDAVIAALLWLAVNHKKFGDIARQRLTEERHLIFNIDDDICNIEVV